MILTWCMNGTIQPTTQPVTTTDPSESAADATTDANSSNVWPIIVGVLAACVLILLIVLILRNRRPRAAHPDNDFKPALGPFHLRNSEPGKNDSATDPDPEASVPPRGAGFHEKDQRRMQLSEEDETDAAQDAMRARTRGESAAAFAYTSNALYESSDLGVTPIPRATISPAQYDSVANHSSQSNPDYAELSAKPLVNTTYMEMSGKLHPQPLYSNPAYESTPAHQP
eukprot:m.216188 g.216188  ORF g.216188 m.216188 type:complete len:227 (-) comp54099_c0_seq9:417-1097(-)